MVGSILRTRKKISPRRRRGADGVQNSFRRGRRVLAAGFENASFNLRSLGTAGVRVRHLRAAALVAHVQAAILFGYCHFLSWDGTGHKRNRDHQQYREQAHKFGYTRHIDSLNELAVKAVSWITVCLGADIDSFLRSKGNGLN